MDFFVVLNQVAVLFILIVVGFILKKRRILSDEFSKGLASLIISVTLPALIITSMNYEFSDKLLDNSLKILGYGVGAFALMILISYIFSKVFHVENPQRGVYQFLIVFPNTGFMGFPILNAVFGQEGVFYGAIFNLLFNVLLWTLGVYFVSKEKDRKINLKTLINPGTIAVAIGFMLFVLSIKLPYVLHSALSTIGHTTTPLAMMMVGLLLADAEFGLLFKNAKLFIIAAIRLIIVPMFFYFVLSQFNLPDIVLSTLVILCGMPSAANAAIFSRKFDSDYRLASQGVFLTTLLSIGFIPLIIYMIMNF